MSTTGKQLNEDDGATRPKGATTFAYKRTAFGIISRKDLVLMEAEGMRRGLGYIFELVKEERRRSVEEEKSKSKSKKGGVAGKGVELPGFVKSGQDMLLTLTYRKPADKLEVAPRLVCDIHKRAFGWIFPDWAGKYRRIEVRASDHEAPPFYEIPVLMKNLTDDLSEREKYLPNPKEKVDFFSAMAELLAWQQHQITWIHPFNDYNGRTARLISNLVLLLHDLPIISIDVDRRGARARYVSAMQKGDEGDLSDLTLIIAEAMAESLEK